VTPEQAGVKVAARLQAAGVPFLFVGSFSSNMRLFGRGLLVILLGQLLRPVEATTIDPLPWVDLVRRSDFVGTVECEVAGGIVAEYRVLETWKGAATAGERLRIRISPDDFGQRFPTALCGEKYLVAARRNPADNSAPEAALFRVPRWGQPLSWRAIKWDFQTSIYQGFEKLDPRGDGLAVAKRKEETLKFQRSTAEQKELIVLQQNFEKYLSWETPAAGAGKSKSTLAVEAVVKRIRAADTVNGFAEELNYLRVLGGVNGARVATQTLDRGSQGTLEFLSQFTEAEFPEKTDIVHRIGLWNPETAASRVDQVDAAVYRIPAPSESEIEQVAAALQNPEASHAGAQVLTWMIENRPDQAAAVLVGWTPPTHRARRWDFEGYTLGSKFAKYCPSNRVALLTKLLAARDPLIRVSAAVYLYFDDQKVGLKALEQFQTLPGDPGAWAALTLARRGRKEAVGRALELLDPGKDPSAMEARLWEQGLQLKILLSNGAHAAGIALPENDRELRDWWAKHAGRIPLRDPWLPELDTDRSD